MKLVIARHTLTYYIGTLALVLFFSGCADDLMMHSRGSSALASYGIRRETYERITLGQELSDGDIMELEACHVPQETINSLYAEQNNYYFEHGHHEHHHSWPRAVFQENISEVSTSTSQHHSSFASREFGGILHEAEAPFKKCTTKEKGRDVESHAAKITERCEKIEIPAVVSSFSRESHEAVRSLDSGIAHAINDHRNKAKKEALLGSFEKRTAEKNSAQKTSSDTHDLEQKMHSKIKSIF